MTGTRGQAFTLEGLLAALIVLAGLVFALQAVVVTPSSSGTAAAPADTERLNSLLRSTTENGSLKRAVLSWNSSNGFHDSSDNVQYLVDDRHNTTFADALNQTFGNTTQVNILIHHNGTGSPQRMIYNGIPTDGAIRATTTVVIYDWNMLRDAAGNPRQAVSANTDNFYVTDQENNDLYDVLKVEVIVWKP